MSQVKISGNISGTGVFTVTSPNSNSNYTTTLAAGTGTVVLDTLAQTLTNKTLTTPTVAVIKSDSTAPTTFQNSSGTEVGTLCRAWVNFNGTGTIAIRASFNVSSITDTGAGLYKVNFTNSLTDANFSVAISGTGSRDAAGGNDAFNIRSPSTNYSGSGSLVSSSVEISHKDVSGILQDSDVVTVMVFR